MLSKRAREEEKAASTYVAVKELIKKTLKNKMYSIIERADMWLDAINNFEPYKNLYEKHNHDLEVYRTWSNKIKIIDMDIERYAKEYARDMDFRYPKNTQINMDDFKKDHIREKKLLYDEKDKLHKAGLKLKEIGAEGFLIAKNLVEQKIPKKEREGFYTNMNELIINAVNNYDELTKEQKVKLINELKLEYDTEKYKTTRKGGYKQVKRVAKRPVAKRPVAKRPVAKRPVAKRPVAKRA